MSLFYQQDEKTNISHLLFGDEQGLSISLCEFIENKKKKDKSFKTPFYLYDSKLIRERYQVLVESFSCPVSAHYAVKANSNEQVLQTFASLGAGADVVSGGEILAALNAGISNDHIIYSGVAKTKDEIQLAVQKEIKQLNVESPSELRRVGQIARHLGKKVNVAFRLNPDVNPETHPYITTGFRDNKFGMDVGFLPELREILRSYEKEIHLVGLTIHIGSQLLNIQSIGEAIEKTIPIYRGLQSAGYNLQRFDVGGGVGIDYKENENQSEWDLIRQYGQMVSRLLSPLGCEIMIEPGRWLVGRAGILVTEVQYIKQSEYKNFLVVDTGMHHLMRPSLYQAYHRILPLKNRGASSLVYDVVGPICESSDVLGKDREFSQLEEGDLLAIADSGAYGFSMASSYNLHDLPKEYLL